MSKSEPFSRSIAIFAAIHAAISSGIAVPQIGYKSRGHGIDKYSGRGRGNPSGKVYPLYSKRECERRIRQMRAVS